MASGEEDTRFKPIRKKDGGHDKEEEDDDGTEEEEEDTPPPVYTLSDMVTRHQRAAPPYQVGTCIGVTEAWNFEYGDSDTAQWMDLLAEFRRFVDPNIVWSSVMHVTRTVEADSQAKAEHSLYILVNTQQAKPRLLVYHFGSNLHNAFASASVTLPLSGTLPRQAAGFPQKAWEACSAICLALLQVYHGQNARFITLDIALHYLPLMKAAPSYYLVNLFAYVLGGKDFANKIRMGKVTEASRDLGTRFCHPFTEWFAPRSTGMQYDPKWRVFYNSAQAGVLPAATEEAVPESNYLFSAAHLGRGIPASQTLHPQYPELFLLIQRWREETHVTSPHKRLPPNDDLVAVFAQLWSDQQTKISGLAGEIKAISDREGTSDRGSVSEVSSPAKKDVVKKDPEKVTIAPGERATQIQTLLTKADGLIQAIQSLSQKALIKNDSFWQRLKGLSPEDKESAETTAQGISLLIFELEFKKRSFPKQLQLVLSTTLDPLDLHQIRQFFLACQLIVATLLEQAKQRNLAFSQLMGTIDEISTALTTAEAALAQAKKQIAPEATDDAPGKLATIANALLKLHRDANHANLKYHPQQGIHTEAAQILARLAPQASAAASALTSAGSAADAAADDAGGTPPSNVDAALSALLSHMPLKSDDNSQHIQTLRTHIEQVQQILQAMLVVETQIHRRLALKDKIEHAGEAVPDLTQWQQWHNTFRALEFSMREAPPASSKTVSGSLHTTVEEGTQQSTVTRCNISEYVKAGQWLNFIGLLREFAYRLQEDAQQKAIKEVISLSASTGNPEVLFSSLFTHRCDHIVPSLSGESQKMVDRLERLHAIWTEYLKPLSEKANVIVTGIPASKKRLPTLWANRIDAKWAWVITAYCRQFARSYPSVSCCLLICGHEADFDRLHQRPTTLNIEMTARPGYSMPETKIIFGTVESKADSDDDTTHGSFAYQQPLCESYSHIMIALAQALKKQDMLGTSPTTFQVPVHFVKAPDPLNFRNKLSVPLQRQLHPTQDKKLPDTDTWNRFRKILQAQFSFGEHEAGGAGSTGSSSGSE